MKTKEIKQETKEYAEELRQKTILYAVKIQVITSCSGQFYELLMCLKSPYKQWLQIYLKRSHRSSQRGVFSVEAEVRCGMFLAVNSDLRKARGVPAGTPNDACESRYFGTIEKAQV